MRASLAKRTCVPSRMVRCRSNNVPKPPKFTHFDLHALFRKAIVDANNICHSDIYVDEFECAVAWDTVDEIARGIATREGRDPLEDYCKENPDADECRIYDI